MTNTCSVKKRLSALAADDRRRPAASRTTPRSEDRHAPGHRTGDRQSPIGIGIPAENLSAEEHPQRAEQQQHADDPGQLARILVGSVQKHLRHVDQQHHDHAGPGIVVQRPQKPTERLLIVQEQQALVRPSAAGT